MIENVKALHKMGFSLICLHAGTKKPIGKKWTEAPRKTWPELVDQWVPGMNIGVRLGKLSQLTDGSYLTAIDCDVKGSDIRYQQELDQALSTFIQGENHVTVASGRGNGSRHLYIRTKEPTDPVRLAQSREKVKVYSPTTKISRYHRENLTQEELDRGIRLLHAWEISLMGTGQQTVLPPSIHPDTKKPYRWQGEAPKSVEAFELTTVAAPNRSKVDPKTLEPIEFVDVDLDDGRLDAETIAIIREGHNVIDRSAAIFNASKTMAKKGFSQKEIISVFTDLNNYLGQTAFDHRQTSNRIRAAMWVQQHTVAKAWSQSSPEVAFGTGEVREARHLTDEEAEEQLRDSMADWFTRLERAKGEDAKPLPTMKNLMLILQNVVGFDVFKRNEFTAVNEYGCDAPWSGAKKGKAVQDIDLINIVAWLADHYRVEPRTSKVYETVCQISSMNAYHPVRDFLRGLEWDGHERLDDWLFTYMGAQGPEAYVRAAGRKCLTAMVARVMVPGIKYDHALILEGVQGCGKSTAVRILSSPWFSDAKIDIQDKDSVVALQGVWVLELGELAGLRGKRLEEIRAFITRQRDRIRVPYGHIAEDFPRQCVFIGTVNPGEYLMDTTGNRRFWPVQVQGCRFRELQADRDQLLAEAVANWDTGEFLYLRDAKEIEGSIEEQERAAFTDTLVGRLRDFLSEEREGIDVNAFTLQELFGDYGPLVGMQETRADQIRVSECLKALQYSKRRVRDSKSRRKWTWFPPAEKQPFGFNCPNV